MFSIVDKVAFITGGTSGIGEAVARCFIAAGAKVAIVGRRSAQALADDMGAVFIRADVSVEDDVEAALSVAVQQLGKIDILINNAGIGSSGPTIEEDSVEALDHYISVLQKGVYFGMKYGPRHMNDGGSIINTASVAAEMGVYGLNQYSMCKAAVVQLTRTAAIELAPRKIRVNSVLPGTVRTPMMDSEPEEILLTQCLAPLGRVAEIEDLVGVYYFLAAPESAYITGQKLIVDGGLTAGLSVGLMEKALS